MKSAKGSDFERELCKALSKWWTKGARDDVYWRSSGSGARATVRSRSGLSTFGGCGDITAIDPIGAPLTQVCTVELKRGYSASTWSDLFEMDPVSAQQEWERFLEQAIRESRQAGVPHWLLIVRRDRKKALICFPRALWKLMRDAAPSVKGARLDDIRPFAFVKMSVRGKDTKAANPFVHVCFCPLEVWLRSIPPEMFQKLAAHLGS